MDNIRSGSHSTFVLALCAAVALLSADSAFAAADQSASTATQGGVEVTIYPLLVQAPIFGASIDLPSLPSGGGGGESGEQSASTDVSLNSAYLVGIEVQANRWFGEARGVWAALSANRQSPRVSLDTDTRVFNARGGVRFGGGFSATGGVRVVSVDLDATLALPALGREISGTTTKVLWDPLIGLDWRHRAGRWIVNANFQGGGFGVGTDVDTSAELLANWRIIPHMEIRLGYTFLYYKMTIADVSIGSFQRTLISSQTLHGPILGVGIVF
jgi:opacity protein-like surface antigen